MDEPRQFLSQITRSTPLKGAEATAMLRRLLQSQAEGAADGHLSAGVALFGAADMAPEIEKRMLYDQIFFCLMRSLEDYAMLCLMGWDEARHPLDIYLNLDRPELRAFFARARKGLGDEVMARLTGVAPWEVLKKLPAFKGKDFSGDEDALDWAAQEAREILVRFAKLYHSIPEDADTEIGPWQVAYAKAPIGLKLLIDTRKAEDEMLLGSEQADPATQAPPTMFSAPVFVNTHFAERVLHELEYVCRQIKRLARRKLMMMDDLSAVARDVKFEWTEHLKELASKKSGQPYTAVDPAPLAQAEPAASENPAHAPRITSLSEDPNPEHHEEPRHDVPVRKVMEVGGLKIIHSESHKKK